MQRKDIRNQKKKEKRSRDLRLISPVAPEKEMHNDRTQEMGTFYTATEIVAPNQLLQSSCKTVQNGESLDIP
jgi:hypothetical protein